MFKNIPIDISLLPSVEEVTYTKVSPKYKVIQIITSLLFTAIAMIAASIVITTAEEHEYLVSGIIAGAGVLFFATRTFFIYMGYPVKGYALREKDLIYRSGWVFRSTVIIPFARIQHGELTEGLLDRFFKVKKLKIFTAGGSSSDLSIPALPREKAEKLRKYIMERVIEEAEEEGSADQATPSSSDNDSSIQG